MTTLGIIVVLATGLLGLALCLVGMMWKPVRPWDVMYKMFFVFFGVFILVGNVGVANSILNAYPVNAGSSPTIDCPSANACYGLYFNSTGSLMAINSTNSGETWSAFVVANQDTVPAPAKAISENNLIMGTWFVWIFVAVYVIFMIIEIGLWYVDMLKTKRNRRSGKSMMYSEGGRER